MIQIKCEIGNIEFTSKEFKDEEEFKVFEFLESQNRYNSLIAVYYKESNGKRVQVATARAAPLIDGVYKTIGKKEDYFFKKNDKWIKMPD